MKKIICFIFGHQYFVKKEFDGGYCRCLGCKRCSQFFAMNDDVKVLLKWDNTFSELHSFTPTN